MTLIDNAIYVDGLRVATPRSLDETYTLQEAHTGFAWIGMYRPSATELASVAAECARRGIPVPALAFEPGRAIVGTAGVTLYEVGTTKPVQVSDALTRLYVSVDGGMSDNARTALYGAQYSARLASRSSDAAPALVRVVGRHCESGDIIVDADYLPGDVAPGDLLAVPATGAYCFSLSSNYNYVPRPPVVAVTGGEARLIVRGESIDDLLARDMGVTGAARVTADGAAAAPARKETA